MKRKIFVIALAALILTACGDGTEDAAGTASAEITTVTTTEAKTSETEITAASETTTSQEITTASETETTAGTAAFTDDFDEEDISGLEPPESVAVKDLNGDGRRERIHSYNPFGSCDITYYDSNGAKQTFAFEVDSTWGGTWYLGGTGQILNLKFYGNTDGSGTSFEMYLYDFSGADLTLVHSYYGDGGYASGDGAAPDPMTYKIDDGDCTAEEFIAEVQGLSDMCEKELGYPLFTEDARSPGNYIINHELPDNCSCNIL